MIQYSSNEGDLVADFFLGGFSTAKVAIGLNRRAIGFEISKLMFDTRIKVMETITPGYLTSSLRSPTIKETKNLGQAWTQEDYAKLNERFNTLCAKGKFKKQIIAELCEEFGRGRFAIEKALKKSDPDFGKKKWKKEVKIKKPKKTLSDFF